MTADSTQFGVLAVASDDLDLVHASKNGDVSAFEQLVARYDRKLFRIAHRVTHNREDSQDVVQEAFLKVFQRLHQFREESQFSTWVIRDHCEPGAYEASKAAHDKRGVSQ
jgi:RNA polymerase sigma-70 factor (ECF subfamily)